MYYLPKTTCQSIGALGCVGAALSLYQSLTTVTSNIRRDKEDLVPSYTQRAFTFLFGESSSSLSRILRVSAETIGWAGAALGFAALASMSLDPYGRIAPNDSLQKHIFCSCQAPPISSFKPSSEAPPTVKVPPHQVNVNQTASPNLEKPVPSSIWPTSSLIQTISTVNTLWREVLYPISALGMSYISYKTLAQTQKLLKTNSEALSHLNQALQRLSEAAQKTSKPPRSRSESSGSSSGVEGFTLVSASQSGDPDVSLNTQKEEKGFREYALGQTIKFEMTHMGETLQNMGQTLQSILEQLKEGVKLNPESLGRLPSIPVTGFSPGERQTSPHSLGNYEGVTWQSDPSVSGSSFQEVEEKDTKETDTKETDTKETV